MKETMVESKVTYTLEHDGKFFIVENVPARVCRETGEQFFSPKNGRAHPRHYQGQKESRQNHRDSRL